VLVQPRSNGENTYTQLSGLAPGLGFQFGLGAMFRNAVPALTVSTTLAYERTTYAPSVQRTQGGAQTTSGDSSLQMVQVALRAILERWNAKPYLVIAPGWVRLGLPGQEEVAAPSGQTTASGVDAWLSGLAFDSSAGLLCEVIPNVAIHGSVGYRRLWYRASNEGSFGSTMAVAEALSLAFGIEWWP